MTTRRAAYRVADVRAAETSLMRTVPDGALMQRAATGLAVHVSGLLQSAGPASGPASPTRSRVANLARRRSVGRAVAARVVLLVGSGNNGGDALWAGARLARRGARVDAVLLSESAHAEGRAALVRAGGRVLGVASAGPGPGPVEAAERLLADADVVLDGIVGIGASGPLRPLAARLAAAASAGGAVIVAVDLPSGIDPDTGAVADPDAVVRANHTVTFGCLKSGLLSMPAAEYVGVIHLVDIGLGPELTEPADLLVPGREDLAWLMPDPGVRDHKYTRGVVGVLAGSTRYRGAAHLAVAGARRGGAGMVQFLGRDPGLAAEIVAANPDVVVAPDVESDRRSTAWLAGPGMGQSDDDALALQAVLDTAGPVLVDADGLSLVASRPDLRRRLEQRGRSRRVTVITPHDGEFRRLGFDVGVRADEDRVGAARSAAGRLGCVVLLKGARTVVAPPDGPAWICTAATPALATAGSGDVLSGLAAAMLAHAAAAGSVDLQAAARVVAGAATVHGLAGARAASGGRPVTAWDVAESLVDAVAAARTARL